MKITTTPNFEGTRILKYCGFVAGEVIFGANIMKDLFAKIRDNVGGRASSYENTLQDAREAALRLLLKNTKEKGGNAVVGVVLDYHSIGTSNSMLMVCATGTAVVIPDEASRGPGIPKTKVPGVMPPQANPIQRSSEKPLSEPDRIEPAVLGKSEAIEEPKSVFTGDFSVSPKGVDNKRIF